MTMNPKEEIKKLTKNIEQNQNDVELYRHRGFNYCMIGDYNKAISDYDKAIELKSNEAVLYFERGTAYSMKDLAKAINDY